MRTVDRSRLSSLPPPRGCTWSPRGFRDNVPCEHLHPGDIPLAARSTTSPRGEGGWGERSLALLAARSLVAEHRNTDGTQSAIQDSFEPVDAAVIRRITRHTYTQTEHHSRTTHAYTYTHTCAPRQAGLSFSLSGMRRLHPRVGCASQPGCYYRRVPTTSSARPTSTTVCTYIHRFSTFLATLRVSLSIYLRLFHLPAPLSFSRLFPVHVQACALRS